MNLSDQNNGSVPRHGAHPDGGPDTVYPPAASAGRGGVDLALSDLALAEHEPHEGHSVTDSHEKSLHDSKDGPARGHRAHDTHAVGAGAPIPTLDLDVHAMGNSAFPLDGHGPGQDHAAHSDRHLSIDLPLEGDTATMASTMMPDHDEAARLHEAETAVHEAAPADEDDTACR